jgi:hypothetical protein
MTENILGCPEGFPLWQAGGATNLNVAKNVTTPPLLAPQKESFCSQQVATVGVPP